MPPMIYIPAESPDPWLRTAEAFLAATVVAAGGPFGTRHDGERIEHGPFGVPPLTRCGHCGTRYYHHEVTLYGTADAGPIVYLCTDCAAKEGHHA